MTCIAAIAEGGTIWMGADSLGSNRVTQSVRKDPKIFKVGEMLIGFTSSYRMGQLLGYKLCMPKHHKGVSIEEYLHKEFIDEVRRVLKTGGYTTIDNNEEIGGCFLVGYRGRIFRVDNDFQIAENLCNYDSVGCGSQVANGTLFATNGTELNPKERIKLAIKAAEEQVIGVRGPIVIKSLPDNETFENI